MKGVVFPGDYTVEIATVDDPTPGPRDVIVEIRASGMCGTDLKFYHDGMGAIASRQPGPIVMGHEPTGVIVEVGSAVSSTEARVGQRVMIHHYEGCGICDPCRSGWTQMCLPGASAYGLTANGAHAAYMRAHCTSIVQLPDELSFEAGAALSCGTSTAWGALKRLDLSGDQTVAVFGQGPVGLSATLLAAAMGARVIAVDLSDERLERARVFGAALTINASTSGDVVEQLRSVTDGLGVDATIEASGSAIARRQSVQGVRSWGRAAYVGEGGDVSLEVGPDLLRRQVTLHGCWTFSHQEQAACARFIVSRNLDLDALFTERWSLGDAASAYEQFDRQSSGKAVFLM
ncbi:zinc-binding dehydrogenase [Arthrobacter sp. W4I7]|uniref:zinc-dependent alcohol dehydrogenase family protein n=1 Tax=Arthrobacter sp. W4I7 TaxID=3042296 RepID=UPI00277F8236|nr:zinc-binding dehydrogenase [Arthrobacter sp. W4I7]MDQ0691319.1 threonine dehydrogenase-like Zn-dependent dehydrogenase [Arthrobacter sp. W4I7]